jgi:hypothetical protein
MCRFNYTDVAAKGSSAGTSYDTRTALQASAVVVVVECIARNAAVWQARLEARASVEAETEKGHKPNSWADLRALLERYGELSECICSSGICYANRLLTEGGWSGDIVRKTLVYILQLAY